jgi:hypothetical protein
MTLKKLHVKSQLTDSSFTAGVLGFDFPFGHVQSAMSLDWNDSSYTLNGTSTARMKSFDIDSLKQFYNNLSLVESDQDSSSGAAPSFLIEKYVMNFSSPAANYEEHRLKNASATLTINDNDINIHRAKFDMYEGTFGLNGTINFDKQDHINIVCEMVAEDLSLKELISRHGPEDDEFIGKEHFSGSLGLNGSIILKYNQELDYQDQDMIGMINLSLKDGEVISFAPITESLKFIKHENLDTIYLANPKFKVLFHNDEMVIPKTIFKTSLTNIELSGYHSDVENFRYDVMISMNDLLFKSKDKIKDNENDSTTVGKLKHHISVRTVESEMDVSSLSKKHYEQQLDGLQNRHQLVDSILQARKGQN